MTPVFNSLMILMLPIFLGISSLATPLLDRAISQATAAASDMSSRSASTCADPSLARTVYEAFSAPSRLHFLNFHASFVNADSQQPGDGPPFWVFQGPVFKAWPTQQPLTVPLFSLVTTTGTDYIFMIGADASTPPIISGFRNNGLLGWVYDSAVCSSVPLMTAVLAAQSDHYWTTDPDEHADLLAHGWTDGGVIAFVLPLPSL